MKGLPNQVKEQNVQIEALTSRVKSLESQANKNSNNNNSKPPSTDGLKKKTKTLRTKSGKKPDGQEGHEGKTLELSENQDEVITHTVDKCDICG